jgi:putative transposase
MTRLLRYTPGNIVYHVINRGVRRMRLFENDSDYRAFEEVIEETLATCNMRICSYSLMPNHWHFVLWPEQDGDMKNFMHRLTTMHAARWQNFRNLSGVGHIYQGRYKSFPIEGDIHFYSVVRYVECNALRANLVDRAEGWKWSSLWRRLHGNILQKQILSDWPNPEPADWISYLNNPISMEELNLIKTCETRGRPYGSKSWTEKIAQDLNLASSLRPLGRPYKKIL